jgi:hypothetical protein
MTIALEEKIANLEEQIVLYREALTIIAEDTDANHFVENGQFAAEVLENMIFTSSLQPHITNAVSDEREELCKLCDDMAHADTYGLPSRIAYNSALAELTEVIVNRDTQQRQY